MAAIVITPRNVDVYHSAGLSPALGWPFPGTRLAFPGARFPHFHQRACSAPGKPRSLAFPNGSTVPISSRHELGLPGRSPGLPLPVTLLFSRLVCSSSDPADS
jgi:hypothetical protein